MLIKSSNRSPNVATSPKVTKQLNMNTQRIIEDDSDCSMSDQGENITFDRQKRRNQNMDTLKETTLDYDSDRHKDEPNGGHYKRFEKREDRARRIRIRNKRGEAESNPHTNRKSEISASRSHSRNNFLSQNSRSRSNNKIKSSFPDFQRLANMTHGSTVQKPRQSSRSNCHVGSGHLGMHRNPQSEFCINSTMASQISQHP